MVADSDDAVACHGRWRVATYDVARIEAIQPNWRHLSDEAKLLLHGHVEPDSVDEFTNVTCVGLHEWIVDCLNASTTAPADVSEVALGRSDATPSTTDTSLNDEVGRVGVTEFADESDQLRVTSFVGEGEANVDTQAGETISEGGVYAGDTLLNHSLFDTAYEKDDTKTMTCECVLAFSDGSA